MWPHAVLLCAKALHGLESDGAERTARGAASPFSVRSKRVSSTMNWLEEMATETSEFLPKGSFAVVWSLLLEKDRTGSRACTN